MKPHTIWLYVAQVIQRIFRTSMRPVDLGLFEALPLRYGANTLTRPPAREPSTALSGKKTVEKKLTLQTISLLEPKRSKLWDFVFNGEASRAWLPIMMRMYQCNLMYIPIEMCSVITSPSPCVQLCCSIANAKRDEKPMPLQEHLSRSISKFKNLTSLSNRPTTLRKNQKQISLAKIFGWQRFPALKFDGLMGLFPLGQGHYTYLDLSGLRLVLWAQVLHTSVISYHCIKW